MENLYLFWEVFKVWFHCNLKVKIVRIVLGIQVIFFPYSLIFRIVEPPYLFIYLFCSVLLQDSYYEK